MTVLLHHDKVHEMSPATIPESICNFVDDFELNLNIVLLTRTTTTVLDHRYE